MHNICEGECSLFGQAIKQDHKSQVHELFEDKIMTGPASHNIIVLFSTTAGLLVTHVAGCKLLTGTIQPIVERPD